jgi:hypothetical protein
LEELSVYLLWGHNAFLFFAFDLLHRMRGTYQPYFMSSMHALKFENGQGKSS